MSDRQGPATALEKHSGDRLPAIAIEAVSRAHGIVPMMRQPSLGIRLHVNDPTPVPEASLQAIFGGLGGGDRPHIVEQLAVIFMAMLDRHHYPIVTGPQIRSLAGDRWTLRLPVVDGLHLLLTQLATSVTGILDHLSRGREVPAEAIEELERQRKLLRDEGPAGKNSPLFLAAALAAGIPWLRLSNQIYQFGHGCHLRWFLSSVSDQTPYLGALVSKDKFQTTNLLRSLLLPVPANCMAATVEEAVQFAERNGYPVVVKPVDLNRGIGVFARLGDAAAVRAAYAKARAHSENIMVEQYVPGRDYRLHVFSGSVYRVRHRVPGGVTGDGRSSVRALLDELNADPRRGPAGSSRELVRIEASEDAEMMLAQQALSWESVPADGRFVALCSIANVSSGGQSNEIPLAEVHADNIAMAERAVALLGLDIAAVDFLGPDIGRSWQEVGGAICEINVGPEVGADAPEKIFAALFPNQGRIPIGLVIGEPGGPAWLAELRERLAQRGVTAGAVINGEAWIGNERIARLPRQGHFDAAAALLRERRVEQLIVQLDAGFLQHGLPCDRIDWLAIDRASLDESASALVAMAAPFAEKLLLADGLAGDPAGPMPVERIAAAQWAATLLDMQLGVARPA